MTRVTGPSFNRDTSIIAPNSPSSTGPEDKPRRRVTNRLYSPSATSGLGRPHEGGPPTLAYIPIEGELAHHEDPAAHLIEGPIHLSFGIAEDPKTNHLLRHPVRFEFTVSPGKPDKKEKAAADRGHSATPHSHRSFGDALENNLHSTVTDLARFLG